VSRTVPLRQLSVIKLIVDSTRPFPQHTTVYIYDFTRPASPSLVVFVLSVSFTVYSFRRLLDATLPQLLARRSLLRNPIRHATARRDGPLRGGMLKRRLLFSPGQLRRPPTERETNVASLEHRHPSPFAIIQIVQSAPSSSFHLFSQPIEYYPF
jgi:hypothetical protein